jgi:hypothetical protein
MKKLDIYSIIGMVLLIFIWAILPPKISYSEQTAPPQKVKSKVVAEDKEMAKLLKMDKEFNEKYVAKKKKEFAYTNKLENRVTKQQRQIYKLNAKIDTLIVFVADTVELQTEKKRGFIKRLLNIQ